MVSCGAPENLQLRLQDPGIKDGPRDITPFEGQGTEEAEGIILRARQSAEQPLGNLQRANSREM